MLYFVINAKLMCRKVDVILILTCKKIPWRISFLHPWLKLIVKVNLPWIHLASHSHYDSLRLLGSLRVIRNSVLLCLHTSLGLSFSNLQMQLQQRLAGNLTGVMVYTVEKMKKKQLLVSFHHFTWGHWISIPPSQDYIVSVFEKRI